MLTIAGEMTLFVGPFGRTIWQKYISQNVHLPIDPISVSNNLSQGYNHEYEERLSCKYIFYTIVFNSTQAGTELNV